MSDFDEMNEGLRWYVVHTYSGYENKVRTNLQKIIDNRHLEDRITEICIPTETIVESDGGKEREVESKIFPAYVLVKMVMTDETWHIVRNITGVTGFVGPGSRPVPLSNEEVEAILGPSARVEAVAFEVGDIVDIIDGVFSGFSGKLLSYDAENGECTVSISTVGNDMTVTLRKEDIKKNALA